MARTFVSPTKFATSWAGLPSMMGASLRLVRLSCSREGHLQSATHSCVTYGPYVTQNRKEGPHMSTKSALRADLDAEDRKTLAEDRKRMERLGKGSQLDDWLAFGPGLLIRRRLAKNIAGLA